MLEWIAAVLLEAMDLNQHSGGIAAQPGCVEVTPAIDRNCGTFTYQYLRQRNRARLRLVHREASRIDALNSLRINEVAT